jgi:DNA-binding CsgD family transcriptional regulator
MIDIPLIKNVFSFARRSEQFATPANVLAALDVALSERVPLKVLAAARIPISIRDWPTAQLGETVFLGDTVPPGWWDEYMAMCQSHTDQDLMMARTSLAPYTWSESRKMLQPIGVDHWPYDLALEYGVRDGLSCPVGKRWIMAFWSPTVLDDKLSQESIALVFLAANIAAVRLEQLLTATARRIPRRTQLTSRELAVLRLASLGRTAPQIAKALDLGTETIRSHIKKARTKLGARTLTQSVAEALRQHLIP